jgi:hypothetical protein
MYNDAGLKKGRNPFCYRLLATLPSYVPRPYRHYYRLHRLQSSSAYHNIFDCIIFLNAEPAPYGFTVYFFSLIMFFVLLIQ